MSRTDVALAQSTFVMMGEALEEVDRRPPQEAYVQELLDRDNIWVYAALQDQQPVGGLVAHVLPMSRAESTELLLYDLAVRAEWRRHGIGHALVGRVLRDAAAQGLGAVWVPTESQDNTDALDFYRAVGGQAQAVTIFTLTVDPAVVPNEANI